MRLVDVILSLPLILVTLVAVVVVGQSLGIIVAVLSLWIWPRFARMMRGEVLQIKTMDYVAMARVSGAYTRRGHLELPASCSYTSSRAPSIP